MTYLQTIIFFLVERLGVVHRLCRVSAYTNRRYYNSIVGILYSDLAFLKMSIMGFTAAGA